VKKYARGLAYLRAAVERYPHDAWLHHDLAAACRLVLPADYTESLPPMAAASALWPDCAWFPLKLGDAYFSVRAYDRAIDVYRKTISRFPFYAAPANLW